MRAYRFTLRPLTAFGSALAGDTLFGQLCWTLRNIHGEARLTELLQGYAGGSPFAVLSDAFPHNFLPLPCLPSFLWADDISKKQRKAMRWILAEHLGKTPDQWLNNAVDDEAAYGQGLDPSQGPYAPCAQAQPHNSINRLSGATDENFTPYAAAGIWHHPATRLTVYAVLDEKRLDAATLRSAMEMLGKLGYGRDASTGLGKFDLEGELEALPEPAGSRAFLTLAPCAPQGLGYDAEKSFYQIKTHFGRHGDMAALSGNPFKKPLLMAQTGAVFSLPRQTVRLYLGQGISGVSTIDARAVHQGYAPVVPLPDSLFSENAGEAV